MSQQPNYSDPYSSHQVYNQSQQQYPPQPHPNYPTPDYSSDTNPYDDAPRYPAYAGDPSGLDYGADQSTEKIVNPEGYGGTERQQPGRSGLSRPMKSFAEMGPPPRSTGILHMWRKDERGQQWFRGGGFRSFLRLCCCCFTISVICLVSIVLAIALYVRPPNIALNSVDLGSSPVSLTSSGLTVSFNLGIAVTNPNWFGVDFPEISATARYPGNNTNTFGGGHLYNVNFGGNTKSSFDFPFLLNYTTALDPNRVILNDLISKCGITGGAAQDITIDYTLNLHLKVLGVTVKPAFSNSASFECPITAADLEGIIGGGL